MSPDRNLAVSIYQALRRDILELRFQPGERISEVLLAKKYRVSRAPVRDALRRLEQEKLVIVKPQVGTMVLPVSLGKAREILQVRLLLEPFAAEAAARKITDEDIELLDFHFSRLARVKDGEEKKRRLYETDALLHGIIWGRCGNREVKDILDRYRGEIQRIRLSNAELGGRLIPSEQEMRRIHRALVRKDAKGAREAILLHLKNIQKGVESIFGSNGASRDQGEGAKRGILSRRDEGASMTAKKGHRR